MSVLITVINHINGTFTFFATALYYEPEMEPLQLETSRKTLQDADSEY